MAGEIGGVFSGPPGCSRVKTLTTTAIQAQPADMPAQAQPQVVYVQQPGAGPQQPVDYRLANRGIDPQNGHYEQESYCGILSVVIGVFLFPCICCCPIDQRETWVDNRTGRKVVLQNNAL